MDTTYTLIGVRPIKDWVFVDIYDDGETYLMLGGQKFWTPADDKFGQEQLQRGTDQKHPGIRGRWAMVLGVNDKSLDAGIKPGQKVFLEELRWTRSFKYSDNPLDLAWAIPCEEVLAIDTDGFNDQEREKLQERHPEMSL